MSTVSTEQMLSPNLVVEAWAVYMLVAVLVYFLPRTSRPRRSTSTIMHQGPDVGLQPSIHSQPSPVDGANDIFGGWLLRVLEMSTYISVSKVCLVTLYFISLLLVFSDSYAVPLGTWLFRVLSFIFLLEDTALPMLAHLTILSHGVSRVWSRLYLRTIVPFLFPVVALSIYRELTTHPGRVDISMRSNNTATVISCVLLVVFSVTECILLYLLHKHSCALSCASLRPDLCQLSYHEPNLNNFFKQMLLIYSLSNNVYKLIVRRVVKLITLVFAFSRESMLQPDTHYIIITTLITVRFTLALDGNIAITHFGKNGEASPFHSSRSLLHIVTDPTLLKLFLRYSSYSTQAVERLLFLYDASLYRLQLLVAQNINLIKESTVTLSTWWFQDSQYFPPKVVQKINERVLTLLLRSPTSGSLPELQREALDILSLPEKCAYSFLTDFIIPAFYQSPLGISALIISILFDKVSLHGEPYFKKALHKLFKQYGQHEKVSAFYDMLHLNPLLALFIPEAISCVMSDTTSPHQSHAPQLWRKRSQSIAGTHLGYFSRKSCFLNKCLFKQLSDITAHIFRIEGRDSAMSKRLMSSIQDLEFVGVHNRLFSLETSHSIDYIQQIMYPLVGSRRHSSYKRILSKYNLQSSLVPTKGSSSLLCVYTSLSTDSTDLTKSVDEFLSTTFCPRPSFDSMEKLKETDSSNCRLSLKTKSFIGTYLVKHIVQLNQPVHPLFKDLDDREKRKFHGLCIPKHAFFSTEAFILSINSYADCSFWPSFQETDACGSKSISFQFAHSRDGTEKSPRMIVRTPVDSSKHIQVTIISNRIKLFRLLYSALHHLGLITDFRLPLEAISTLCLWLTTNETSVYYNSSTVIYVIRTAFVFLCSMEHDAPGFLPKDVILAMLLSALCSTYKHSGLSNKALISSAHWLADLYADIAPSTNFCTAAGWIAIVQSGLLAHSDLITRRRIRSFYLTFSRSFSEDIAVTNYYDILQSLTDRSMDTELEAFKLKLCKLFTSFLLFSAQAYNKATSLHLSVSKHLDVEEEMQLLSYVLPNQEPRLNKSTYPLDTIVLRETVGLTTIALPILMLLKESLNFISNSYRIRFEYVLRQIELFTRHISASANMWACMLK